MPTEKKPFNRMKVGFESNGTVTGTCKLRGAERVDGVIGFSEIQEKIELKMKTTLREVVGCQNCGMRKGVVRNKPEISARITFLNEKMEINLNCKSRHSREDNANCYSTFPPEEPVDFKIIQPDGDIPF